jgi:Ca-activated chloride channel family protein
MRNHNNILFILLFVGAYIDMYAQSTYTSTSNTQLTRILFVLDASGSMQSKWGKESKWETAQRVLANISDTLYLNKNVDFTFDLHYQGTGDWGNYADYEVKVSDKKRDAIPEKEVMHVPEVIEAPKMPEIATIDISQIKKSKRPIFPV